MNSNPSDSARSEKNHYGRLHLWIALAVIAGTATGLLFRDKPVAAGIGTPELGELGLIAIRFLKAVAVPLVLFATLNSVLSGSVSRRKGGRLVMICLLNVSVAAAIALVLVNTFRPGAAWQERVTALSKQTHNPPGPTNADRPTLNPLKNLSGFIPGSLFQPFVENNLISVVLIGLFLGAALRRTSRDGSPSVREGVRLMRSFVAAGYELLLQMVRWVVSVMPLAVFGVVAQAVGRSGLEVFTSSVIFIAATGGALLAHGLLYYPCAAWVFGGRSPKQFFGGGAQAILTGLSTNSSLACVPITLHCLTKKLGVTESSATLSACIGTNLNNDGVTLYEAMAALFLAQACGLQLGLPGQLLVIVASLMAAIGCVGVPEAGLVLLPLVLSSVGLPEWLVAAAIPLLLPVDWLVARLRSAVNVMSDILVAIMLDGRKSPPQVTPSA